MKMFWSKITVPRGTSALKASGVTKKMKIIRKKKEKERKDKIPVSCDWWYITFRAYPPTSHATFLPPPRGVNFDRGFFVLRLNLSEP